MNRLNFLAILLLSATALPALALPGEAAAVMAHCGAPNADTQSTSQVNNLPMRTLTYGHMRLNFEQIGSGWSFTTGWNNHIPENMNEVAKHMPCFSAAMNQVAAAADRSGADPTIVAQTTIPTLNRATFGIANLWLILFIAGAIAVFGILIPRARKMVRRPKLQDRILRRPRLNMVSRFRRRPVVTTVPEKL